MIRDEVGLMRLADAVATLDLNYRSMPAAVLALTAGLILDATGANRCGLAVIAAPPQIGAEVGHQRFIGRGRLRIKSGSSGRRLRQVA